MSPSGKVHLYLWKTAWWLPCAVAFGFLIPAVLTVETTKFLGIVIGILLGYSLGYFIDPDLDLVSTSSAEGRMLKIPVLGIFLVTYWTLYGAIFRKHHRSFWTHSYIVSTGIRFAYTFWWMVFIPSMDIFFGFVLVGAFLGLCISDGVHIYADNYYGGR